MALTKLVKINDNSFWAVWKVEESLSELLTLLRPGILDIQYVHDCIHHPKKKLEWIAGRLALDSILQHMGVRDYQLLKDVHGKPFLSNSNIHVSLANSLPYATAIVSTDVLVGIDIERPSEKLRRVARKFLSSKELDIALTDIDILCFFWCAKEAVYKIHGRKQLSFKDHMYIDVAEIKSGILPVKVRHPDYTAYHTLIIERLNEYYVCYNTA